MNDEPNASDLQSALDLIATERYNQDAEWDGPSHDDNHEPWTWVAFIVRHLGKAVHWDPFSIDTFQRQMIRVAALAAAAYQASVRKSGSYLTDEDL